MKIQNQIKRGKIGEHGLVKLSLFRRFVKTQGGQYAAKISGALFSAGN